MGGDGHGGDTKIAKGALCLERITQALNWFQGVAMGYKVSVYGFAPRLSPRWRPQEAKPKEEMPQATLKRLLGNVGGNFVSQ